MAKFSIILFSLAMLFLTNPVTTHGLYVETSSPAKNRDISVKNQFIIKFKADHDPRTLNALVAKRAKIKSNILGRVRLMFSDALSKKNPEKELVTLETVFKSVGGVEMEPMSDVENDNSYLIKTNGKKTLSEIKNVYEKLGIVESVQPNFLYYPLEMQLP